MEIFIPQNNLELRLLQAKEKIISEDVFVKELINSDLAMPSATEVKDDGTGFQPILFDKHGVNMLAAFTDKGRIGELRSMAKYCLTMNGMQVLRRIPPGCGLVLNPGGAVGIELSQEGIVQIIKDMG
jgi:hypothetical protein